LDKKIDISVICLTYNHEKFILDTLNGFLQQETRLNIEYIINDDASTDKTSEIIEEFIVKNKQLKIKYIKAKKNEYSEGKNPGVKLLSIAKGRYTALCEGDDYWIDGNKLQKQYEFLEENKDYSMYIHPSYIREGDKIDSTRNKCHKKYSTVEIMKQGGGSYSTSSAFYRSNINQNIIASIKMYNKLPGDLIVIVEASRHGLVHCSDEIMSIYRVHRMSVTHNEKNNKDLVLLNELIHQIEEYYLNILNSPKELKKVMQNFYYSYKCNQMDFNMKNMSNMELNIFNKFKLSLRWLTRIL